jgi:hypothetical protein
MLGSALGSVMAGGPGGGLLALGLPTPPRPEHHVIAVAGELATVLGAGK